ncbi:MAG: DEAD/DEAH box helicase family protein [Pseudomonadota bacterium]
MSSPFCQATVTGATPPLRDWQSACLRQALDSLSPERPHFLCQATPGAGKMLMAAVLADELLSRGEIDYVLYLGPTRAVVQRAIDTLSEVTGRPLHGKLGASGAGFTYHALQHRLEELKCLARQARVLLIWDESHHAAGSDGRGESANQWGMALMALERHVRYTLALSGTPWRTDGSCLPLLRYVEVAEPVPQDERDEADETRQSQRLLQPDYVYTLKEAIRDGICRYPQIELVDNRSIALTRFHPRTGRKETRRYPSIPHVLRHPQVHYASLVRDDAPMERVLALGIERLEALRRQDPGAGGLVVAADIEHAEEIAQRLEDAHQSVCLVTSRSPNAHALLETCRDARTAWIVSVGMVSEGVDIPRLRVCCYLSHIRTEQHFRQVLGRIIRRTGADDSDCVFYALNEPTLRRFARRLSDDLPQDLATVASLAPLPAPTGVYGSAPDGKAPTPASPPEPGDAETPSGDASRSTESSPPSLSLGAPSSTVSSDPDVAFSEAFFERLVALRLSP